MSKLLMLLAGIVLCGAAAAESFAARFDRANALLAGGDAPAALELYREMQIDYPDSDVLRYAVATAHHRAGRNSAAQDAREAAKQQFEAAKTAFEEVIGTTDAALRAEAAFGAADSVVQQAMLNEYDPAAAAAPAAAITAANAAAPMGAPDNYKIAVDGWRAAVQALESVVREYPDLERAQRNLDAARYRLKKLLQNPPEDQEQEKQEQPQDQPPPPMVVLFNSADTDIPRAKAEVTESGDRVRLVRPDAGGSK